MVRLHYLVELQKAKKKINKRTFCFPLNILSYKNFVHYELYLLIFEHSLISDYRVQQYDTKGIKMSTILKQNRSDFLLFLVEFVTLFEDRINIAQMLDQFDCQARCT